MRTSKYHAINNANRTHRRCSSFGASMIVAALSGMLLTASFKLLINFPCLLDLLNRLLKKTRNGLIGRSGIFILLAAHHVIQLTLCPCREGFTVRIAKCTGKFL